ncbi:hypothetical protein Ahos_1522 [Acidianus hospitalis W1]|uniref:Uncharacterized protein n=1 Tax=Acidianus hospitalis (strain W1) TaxID=933801 RepID=F4B5I1_ACIHW|nr:hypothetical protein [Acidianus hospitalis]AEE94405.1 hypothetical protein Ahos_1522 [Acidianus hospitalis W1]
MNQISPKGFSQKLVKEIKMNDGWKYSLLEIKVNESHYVHIIGNSEFSTGVSVDEKGNVIRIYANRIKVLNETEDIKEEEIEQTIVELKSKKIIHMKSKLNLNKKEQGFGRIKSMEIINQEEYDL